MSYEQIPCRCGRRCYILHTHTFSPDNAPPPHRHRNNLRRMFMQSLICRVLFLMLAGAAVLVQAAPLPQASPEVAGMSSERQITVHDLLRHTSALTYGVLGTPNAVKKMYKDAWSKSLAAMAWSPPRAITCALRRCWPTAANSKARASSARAHLLLDRSRRSAGSGADDAGAVAAPNLSGPVARPGLPVDAEVIAFRAPADGVKLCRCAGLSSPRSCSPRPCSPRR